MTEERLEWAMKILLIIPIILISLFFGMIFGVLWYDGKYRPGIEKYLQECSHYQGSGHASDDR